MLVKIPMVPFHLLLPEAHVEAPTVGSVYLASILLKLGSYGLLRLILPIFPYGTLYYTPAIQMLAILSIIYCSGIIIRQVDLKKIVAYSSIIHMNMAMLSLFTFNSIGVQGALLLMFGHGLTSGALFFLVGLLYDRYKTKLIFYYSGLAATMPIFAFIFLFFSFCNIGFPGTLNFSSELLIFIGVIEYGVSSKTFFFVFLLSVGLFSSICYSIWLANKILFGNVKEYLNNEVSYVDLTEREILVLLPFTFFIIFFGLNSFILQFTSSYTKILLSLFV
jgi:proton-translocating NADH-quinone oxidoreductase chain M